MEAYLEQAAAAVVWVHWALVEKMDKLQQLFKRKNYSKIYVVSSSFTAITLFFKKKSPPDPY